MYKYFVEEFQFASDLKRRSNLFVSLFRNKDAISALLWIIGVSIVFFGLSSVAGFYIFFLFPAVLGLYLLVAYQLFLSFIIFKINAFNAQRQFKDSSSNTLKGYFSNYINKFTDYSSYELGLFENLIKDLIKSCWSGISKVLGTVLKKIRFKKVLGKFQLHKKFIIRRKNNELYKKISYTIRKSHSHFWQIIEELVTLCFPIDSRGKGFSDAYLNILIVFYYEIPLNIIRNKVPLFREFILNLLSLIGLLLMAIPRLSIDIFVITILNILLRTLFAPIYFVMAIFFLIVAFFKSIFDIFVLLFNLLKFVVLLPVILIRFINQIVLFLKGLTLNKALLGIVAISFVVISLTSPLLVRIFDLPFYLSDKLVLSITEFLSIIAIFVIVIFSFTVKTQKAYLGSIALLFILAVVYGAYFVVLASLLLFYCNLDPFKKTVHAFIYLLFIYLIQALGFSGEYLNNIGMALLLVTDYEEDVEFYSFLSLALHGSYQELRQSLKKRVGLYDEHAETTEESVNFANNYNKTTDTCYRETDTEGMTSNACDEVTTQPPAILLDRGKRGRLFRRYTFHKSRRRRNPHDRRRRRARYTRLVA